MNTTANNPDSKPEDFTLKNIVDRIPHRIVVFSGKGGVGKTTVAVNLAYLLVARGRRVGLLDADITGPNVVQMTGITEPAQGTDNHILPHEQGGLKVVSLASMIPEGEPVIWRGPMRSKAIEQLLTETEWGDLDMLIVDLPPGTGDESLTIAQRIAPQVAIVVTTPQEVSLLDARRAVNMAKKLGIPTIGLVENMSGFVCPHCGESIDLFGSARGKKRARAMKIEHFGEIPLDSSVPPACDRGTPIVLKQPEGAVARALKQIAECVLAAIDQGIADS